MGKKLFLLAALLALSLSMPARAELVGWWKLDDGEGTVALDSSDNENHGTLEGNVNWITGGQFGGALYFDPPDDDVTAGHNVSLPIGPLLSGLTNSTFLIWANFDNDGGAWQRLWDFGTSPTEGYMFLCPRIGTGAAGTLRYAITVGTNNAEEQLNAPFTLPSDWHHVAIALNADNGTMVMYVDGDEIDTQPATIFPTDLGVPTQNWLGQSQWPDGIYNGALDDFQIYDETLTQRQIQGIMSVGFLTGGLSYGANPENGQIDVDRDGTVLSWSSGFDGAGHDVYFGASPDNVTNASRNDPLGVLVSQNQSSTSYALERLDLGQTYYWRIDEVNRVDNSILKGLIWSFTVEPLSYVLPADRITATASSQKDINSGPENTINSSGLDDNDGHSVSSTDMWFSASGDGAPWVQYEFKEVYKLDKMLVWNSNVAAEGVVGYGVKDVQIETSLDGTTWTVLDGITQLTRAPGSAGAGPTDSFDLDGTSAKYIRVTIANNWGGLLTQYSLSEVRFYYFRVKATQPVPASGATGVQPDSVLGWRAGREAGTHEVFVGTDANGVLDGSVQSVTVADNSAGLAPFDLPLGETYFWKVNEVNDAEDPSVWEGPIWEFSIPDPLVVDDFESYGNNSPDKPYQTWIDGLGYTQPAPGVLGNNTGALVGHDVTNIQSPYFNHPTLMEQDLIYRGEQSLPFNYNNSGIGNTEPYSEMTRTFNSAQDWSVNAISTLTLYFRGMERNSGQLYVKINDSKVLFTDDPGAISRPMWEQWNIDLASTDADLSNVQSLSIGVEEAGSGLLFVDDILLYRNAPVVVQGINPGNAGLVASYSMENNVNDGIGNYHGTAIGNPRYTFVPDGMALVFDGIEDHVELPISPLLASLTDMTVASWVNFSGDGDGWQRVFDFGQSVMDVNDDPNDYIYLAINSGNGTGPMRFALTAEGQPAESGVNGLVPLPSGDWHHLAATIDSSTMTMALYMDGSVVGSGPTALLPQDVDQTDQNWLGRSQWPADPFFDGALDEFLIYDRALSEAEIRYLAGEQ